MKDIDGIWKEIIELLFDDFVSFFLPDLYNQIDWSIKPSLLDKELSNIFQNKKKGVKYSDLLFQFCLKDQTEQWALFHIELQSQNDQNFDERMFVYYYRIFDKYQKKIVAFALFADGDPNYHPGSYSREFYGTDLKYRYNTYKILNADVDRLKKSSNLFALVILAAYYTLKTEGKNEKNLLKRLEFKKRLTDLLLEKKIPEDKIKAIFIFIDNMMNLTNDLEIQYQEEVEEKYGGENMKALTMENTHYFRVAVQRAAKKESKKFLYEGELKGKREDAIKMLQDGLDMSKIAYYTDLSIEEIRRLKDQIQ